MGGGGEGGVKLDAISVTYTHTHGTFPCLSQIPQYVRIVESGINMGNSARPSLYRKWLSSLAAEWQYDRSTGELRLRNSDCNQPRVSFPLGRFVSLSGGLRGLLEC